MLSKGAFNPSNRAARRGLVQTMSSPNVEKMRQVREGSLEDVDIDSVGSAEA